MIGRADIEGSKSNVAMYAWLPQVSSFIPTYAYYFPNASLVSTFLASRKPYTWTLSPVGVARTLSTEVPMSYRALNRPAVAESAADYLYSAGCHPTPTRVYNDGRYPAPWYRGPQDFPASRHVAYLQRRLPRVFNPLTCRPLLRQARLDLFVRETWDWNVYPCGNFSDTSSLKLVKLKDQ